MKYIRTVDNNDKHEIFVFPNSVNHDVMAEALAMMKNQTHGNWQRVFREPVSAGFVNAIGQCYGESETLGLESMDWDTELVRKQMGIK